MAKFELAKATISYVADNGGTVGIGSESVYVLTGDPVGSIALPSEGYEFVQWTDPLGNTVSTTAYFIPEKVDNKNVSKIYIAHFSPLSTHVHTPVEVAAVEATCEKDGLTAGTRCSVCGETITEQTFVPRLGHNAVKDVAVSPTQTSTGLTEGEHCSRCNKVLVAQTVIPMITGTTENSVTIFYTVDYSDRGTVSTAYETVSELTGTPVGSTATAGSKYIFESWKCNGVTVSTNQTFVPTKGTDGKYVSAMYTACFIENTALETPTYTVTFVYNVDSVQSTSVSVEEGKTISLPTAVQVEGMTFKGWYTDESYDEKFISTTPITENCTLYGYYTAKTYKVTFYNDGGSLGSRTYEYGTGIRANNTDGSAVVLPDGATTPVRTGYIFCGWAMIKDSDTVVDWIKVTGPMSLYPVFKQQVTVIFNVNAGDNFVAYGTNNIAKVETGHTFHASDFTVNDSDSGNKTRTGFTFLGWYTDKELTKKWNYTANADCIIYASWESEAAPYYNPTVAIDEDVLLGSTVDEEGNTTYVYYIGTIKNVLVDEEYRLYVNKGITVQEASWNVTGETVTDMIEKTVTEGSSVTTSESTTTTKEDSSIDGWGAFSGVCGIVSGVASIFPAGKVLGIAASTISGVAGAVGGGSSIISALTGGSSSSTTSTTKTNGTETWHEMSTTTGYSNATSTSEGASLTVGSSLVDIANPGDIFVRGIIANVEYIQVVVYDKNGNWSGECITYNIYNATRGAVSLHYSGDNNGVSAVELPSVCCTPVETDVSIYGQNAHNSKEDFDAFLSSAGITGTGTSSDPYVISDDLGLYVMTMRPSSCYKLGKDINLSGTKYWTPFEFKGILDGNGHTISGLTLEADTNGNYGLFSSVKGKVKNLTLSGFTINFNVSSTHVYREDAVSYIGILAGQIEKATLYKVTVKDSAINSKSSASWIGGLTGWSVADQNNVKTSTISNCTVSNCKFTNRGETGGIIGFANDLTISDSTVTNCTFDITAEGSEWSTSERTIYLATGAAVGVTGGVNISNMSVKGNTTINLYGKEGSNDTHYVGKLVGMVWDYNEISGTISSSVTFNKKDSYTGDVRDIPNYNNGKYSADLDWVGHICDKTKYNGTYYHGVISVSEFEQTKNSSDIFKQEADLKFTSNWNPGTTEFRGKYYGMGYTISDVKFSGKLTKYDDGVCRWGLFPKTHDALLAEINVTGGSVSNITNGKADDSGNTVRAGFIVGNAYNTTIANCKVTSSYLGRVPYDIGDISGHGVSSIGLIVGYAESGTMVDGCIASDSSVWVGARIIHMGGIVGYADNSTITNCTSQNNSIKGTLHGTIGYHSEGYAGGIVGYLSDTGTCTNNNYSNNTNGYSDNWYVDCKKWEEHIGNVKP